MSLDISSSSGRRTDLLLFPRQDSPTTTTTSTSSLSPSSSSSSILPPPPPESASSPHTPLTTTSASASSLLSSDESTPTPGLTPSSSSNSVWTAASTADTSSPSSPLSQQHQQDEYQEDYDYDYDEQDQHDQQHQHQHQHERQHEHNEEDHQDARRSFDHPAPLATKTKTTASLNADSDEDENEDEKDLHRDDISDASSSHSHETLRTAPRSPSLSTLPTLPSSPSSASAHHPAALHSALGNIKTQQLQSRQSITSAPAPIAAASSSAFSTPVSATAPAPAPSSIPYAFNRASIAPIRRKPLSSSARTSIAAASAASASARSSLRASVVPEKLAFESVRGSREFKEPPHLPALPPLPPLPQLRANISPQISPQPEDSSFDLDSELEAEFVNSLQFATQDNGHNVGHNVDNDEDLEDLLSPDHRFTRSGDIDSPTLYDFPKPASGTFAKHVPSSLSRAPSAATKEESESDAPEVHAQHVRPQSQSSESTDSASIKEAPLSPDTFGASPAAAEETLHSAEEHEALDALPLDLVPSALAAPVAALSVSEKAPARNTEESTPESPLTAPSLNETKPSAGTADNTERVISRAASPSLSSADGQDDKDRFSESDRESEYPFDFSADDVDVVDTEDTAEDIRSEYSEHVAADADADLDADLDPDLDHGSVRFDPDGADPVDEPSDPAVPSVAATATQADEQDEQVALSRAALVHSPAGTETISETEETQTPPLSSHLPTRQSTMSLFNRKTSPPHLSLGAISNNNNPSIANATDNAQRAISDNNSVYSSDDKYSPAPRSPLPVIATDAGSSNANSPALKTHPVAIDTNVAGDSPTGTLKPVAKSPSSFKLGNFFGWPSPSPASTEFSDQAYSPLASPSSPSSLRPPNTVVTNASTLSTPASATSPRFPQQKQQKDNRSSKPSNLLGIISPTKSNTSGDEASFYYDDYLQTPPVTATSQVTPTAHAPSSLSEPPLSLEPTGLIEEMEDELKAISAELAGSIRREMDLDDLVERLQAEINNAPQLQSTLASKRTSDYFSDSGTSSNNNNKYSDYDAVKEEIAQVQRRAEQEKAQLRLELTDKLNEERSRRRALDRQIKELSERAAEIDVDELQRNSSDASGRVKQLEGTCEDLRRRLNEERSVKENFEDLLSVMKQELQNTANERDNLRDEIVPQLRARVEGLESQSAEHARQVYETTKMQQELQSLKEENLDLRSTAAAASSAATAAAANILADSEQQQQMLRAGPGLSRSNTVHRSQQQPGGPPSTSASNNPAESREALAERLKDVEAQRDALHSALKSLLERQEFQNRDNDKKIRILEMERQRLLTASPKKAGYERDVANLREEISVLRRRAEEALDQKWQTEKGLGGLKMDLDRAESEISNLRAMLLERDADGGTDGLTSTASLEQAFKDLQDSYASLLTKVSPDSASDEVTTLALERLERALATTVSGHDAARKDVAAARARLAAETGEAGEALMDSERSLSEQLDLSARRVEELAQQVREQIQTNSTLRERLSQMVVRGEASQQANKARITGLESRLRTLEEQLVASQTAAEERVARHEEQVAALNEARSSQLQRLRDASGNLRAVSPENGGAGGAMSPLKSPRFMMGGFRSPGLRSPGLRSPMMGANGKLVPPFAGGAAGSGSSRPSSRGSMVSFNGGNGTSSAAAAAAAAAAAYAHSTAADQEQQAQVTTLRARVGELEAALSLADSEMQEVVGRLSMAQVEVMQLQEELDAAGRDARRLQRTLEEERTKGFEERFRLISQPALAA